MRNMILGMCVVLWSATAWADETSPVTATPLPEQTASASDRDPFWPVNYTPPALQNTGNTETATPSDMLDLHNMTEEQRAKIMASVKISGIFKNGGQYLARINDQLVAEGDVVAVQFEGNSYQFKVKVIKRETVQLEPAES